MLAYDDDDHTAPKDEETVEFTTGYQSGDYGDDDALHRVAEYDEVDDNAIVGLSFATSPFDSSRFYFQFDRTSSNQMWGAANLDLNRLVRIQASMDSMLRRFDHDPLSNLQAVSEIKVIRSTDLDPDGEYQMRHRRWNVDAEFQHPDVSWLTWRVGAREQQREGTKQVLSTSHCTSCHTVGQGREIDQSTTEFVAGVHASPGRYDFDYQITTRDFDEKGATPLAPFENAYRPATPGTAPDPSVLIKPFNDRLWFQAGDYPVDVIPTVRTQTHRFKARAAMNDGGDMNFTAVQSKSENRSTNLETEFKAYRGRYTMRAGKKMRVSFFASRDKSESDSMEVDLVALNALTGAPMTSYGGTVQTFQDWRRAVDDPTLNFETFNWQSKHNRTDDRAGADLYWRASKRGSFRAGYKYRNIDRDNVTLIDGTGETESHRLKLAWNHRIARRVRWNNNLTYTNTSNPYVSDSGALRAFAGYVDEANGIVVGQAGSPKQTASLQYYQLQALRVAHIGNMATKDLKFRSAINWSPKGTWALSGNVRYRDGENDELNYSTWQQNQVGVGVNLWMAMGPTFQFTLGADHAEKETDAFVTVPLMDG